MSYLAVMSTSDRRRPVDARGNAGIRWLASGLARLGVAPNVISAASIGSSALAAVAMLAAAGRSDLARIELFAVAAILLELRLLANLLPSTPPGALLTDLAAQHAVFTTYWERASAERFGLA